MISCSPFKLTILYIFIYPKKPSDNPRKPQPVFIDTVGLFSPNEVCCFKVFVSSEFFEGLLTGIFPMGTSDEGFSFSLNVVLNLLNYWLQTLPLCTSQWKTWHLCLCFSDLLLLTSKTSLNTRALTAAGGFDCMTLYWVFLAGMVSDHLYVFYNVNMDINRAGPSQCGTLGYISGGASYAVF